MFPFIMPGIWRDSTDMADCHDLRGIPDHLPRRSRVGPVPLSTRTRLLLAKTGLELQMLHSQPRVCGLRPKAPHSMAVMSVVVLGV